MSVRTLSQLAGGVLIAGLSLATAAVAGDVRAVIPVHGFAIEPGGGIHVPRPNWLTAPRAIFSNPLLAPQSLQVAHRQPPAFPHAMWRVQTKASVLYRMIDMPTFGGPTGQGAEINASGETTVIGWSSFRIHEPPYAMPIICGGSDNVVKLVTHAFQWRKGVILSTWVLLVGPNTAASPHRRPRTHAAISSGTPRMARSTLKPA